MVKMYLVLWILLDFGGQRAVAGPPEWPQFRGPRAAAVAEAETIPAKFGPGTRVLWKRATPAGHSSPCISGNRIFLTSSAARENRAPVLKVLCFERATGAPAWERELQPSGAEDFLHVDALPATATPCTDGDRVYAHFGSYGLAAFHVDGKPAWTKELAMGQTYFGTGASPILHGDALYLVRDSHTASAVFCFDAATGEERWMKPRPGALSNYASPYIWHSGKRAELTVAGSGVIQSYDLASGDSLWRAGGLPGFVCPSPAGADGVLVCGGWTTMHVGGKERLRSAIDDDLVLTEAEQTDVESLIRRFDSNADGRLAREELPASRLRDAFVYLDGSRDGTLERDELHGFLSQAPAPQGRNVLVAVKAGGKGDVTATHVLWEWKKGVPDVASPLIHRGLVYFVTKGGIFSCLDLQSGTPRYASKRLGVGGEYYATPLAVGDKILVAAERGTVFVLRAGPDFKVLARNELDEEIYATPAVVDNTLYLRTASNLWAFAAPSKS